MYTMKLLDCVLEMTINNWHAFNVGIALQISSYLMLEEGKACLFLQSHILVNEAELTI